MEFIREGGLTGKVKERLHYLIEKSLKQVLSEKETKELEELIKLNQIQTETKVKMSKEEYENNFIKEADKDES